MESQREFMKERRKLIIIFSALISLIIIGTAGYMYFLKVRLVDALYMVVITISTVGYKEVAPMSDQAKLFSIVVIFSGLGVAGYTFTTLMSLLMEGQLKQAWRIRQMYSKIFKLDRHYIICGGGETGQSVIAQFQKSGQSYVVIEKDEGRAGELIENGILTIHGDATQEEVLKRGMIENAKGLISSLSSDAENVFTVLTARELNENLHIVSRAIEKSAHEKLRKAGADNTVSPNEMGGARMAALMLKPSVISFLDIVTHAGDVVLDLEEVEIFGNSDIEGQTLSGAKIPEKTGLIILAIRKCRDDSLVFNPNSDEKLEDGDVVIVLGTDEQIDKLRRIAQKSFGLR